MTNWGPEVGTDDRESREYGNDMRSPLDMWSPTMYLRLFAIIIAKIVHGVSASSQFDPLQTEAGSMDEWTMNCVLSVPIIMRSRQYRTSCIADFN
jgi:hypothetical protein